MERLTTNTSEYHKAVIDELSHIELTDNQKRIFTFCEVGQLWTHGFSVSLIAGEKEYLKLKKWNSESDANRFPLKIFNLNRIAVSEKNVDISMEMIQKIRDMLDCELNTEAYAGIVLDGLYCALTTDVKNLRWNIDEEMNESLNNLISTLRSIVSEHYHLYKLS